MDLINQPKYGFPTIVLYIQCMIGHPSLGWTNCCVIHILYILQCDIIIHRAIQYVCLCVINSFAIKICCNIYSSTFGMNWYQCKIYPGVMCHIRAYTNVSRQDNEYMYCTKILPEQPLKALIGLNQPSKPWFPCKLTHKAQLG